MNQETFCKDQAFFMLMEGKRVGNTAIVELKVPRISKFFLPLVSSKDFLDLDMEELCMILSLSNIRVHCEMEVFMAAVRWLMHDWVVRKASIKWVMRCVRFGLIDSWQHVDRRRNPENPEFILITAHPPVNPMIDDDIVFSIIKFWYDTSSDNINSWIDMLAIVEPEERNWTSDSIKYVHYHDFMRDVAAYKRGRVLERKLSKISALWHCKPTDDGVLSIAGSSVQLQPGQREMPPPQYDPVPKPGFPYSHHRRDHPTHMPHTCTPPTIQEFLAAKMANIRKDSPI